MLINHESVRVMSTQSHSLKRKRSSTQKTWTPPLANSETWYRQLSYQQKWVYCAHRYNVAIVTLSKVEKMFVQWNVPPLAATPEQQPSHIYMYNDHELWSELNLGYMDDHSNHTPEEQPPLSISLTSFPKGGRYRAVEGSTVLTFFLVVSMHLVWMAACDMQQYCNNYSTFDLISPLASKAKQWGSYRDHTHQSNRQVYSTFEFSDCPVHRRSSSFAPRGYLDVDTGRVWSRLPLYKRNICRCVFVEKISIYSSTCTCTFVDMKYQ